MNALVRNPWVIAGAAGAVGFFVGRIVEYRRVREAMRASGRIFDITAPPLEGVVP